MEKVLKLFERLVVAFEKIADYSTVDPAEGLNKPHADETRASKKDECHPPARTPTFDLEDPPQAPKAKKEKGKENPPVSEIPAQSEVTEVSLEQLRELMKLYTRDLGLPLVTKLVNELGASKFSELSALDRVKLLNTCEARTKASKKGNKKTEAREGAIDE